MTFVQSYKEEFTKAADHVKHDIASLRTGRATPALVEDVSIEAYGTSQPLKAVASISVLDAKTLVVEPWDKSLLGAVDAGIRKSELGLNPVNDGKVVRVPLPTLTSERRAELIKILHQKLENGRIAIRKLREDVKQMIDLAESAKEIGEDEKFRQYEELEKLMKEMNERIKVMGEEKEKEINTV
ncbi:MAG: ribosome recycling factor [Patescibacteria group bacterium]